MGYDLKQLMAGNPIHNLYLLFLFSRPAGWDNDKKIAILYENMHTMSPDDYYTDVIVKPQVVRKVGILPLQRDTEENEV